MTYEFDHTLDHRHNHSYRWNMSGFPEDVIGMGTADLDYECAPCLREALRTVAEENTYNYRQKPQAYRDAVKDFYHRFYDLDIDPAKVWNVPSTVGAVRLALNCFSAPGDYVIMQTPHFGPLLHCVEGAGRHIVLNEMILKDGHYELDLADFEKKIKEHHVTAYLMVNPQNPTGRVFTETELKAMTEICVRNNVTIISDEVHSLIVYDGHRHMPILSLPAARPVSVQIVSLSKGFNIMSLPHALVLIDSPEMIGKWVREYGTYSFGYATNSFALAAVTSILAGEADEWLRECTAYLAENQKMLMEYVQEKKLPLQVIRPEASFMAWIDCRASGLNTDDLDGEFMEKAHISLNDGKDHGEAGRGFIRLNYAVTHAVMREALDRIGAMFL
ncbi:MAG: aminotransferase class I/II-fold pyridoxal phosphate-dependent enzyme [Solobacterium sp.]|nr:aminotransferase class I/II-fold pyridoxal phosphate-dependent enzyme [Solobacterium sp.]